MFAIIIYSNNFIFHIMQTLKDIEWEWVPVQEQVVSALRKVTFLCEENHASFVRLGGIGILLQLIEEEYSPSRQNYPPNTLNRFI